MWRTRVHTWPEIEEKLASARRPFTLEVVRHGQTQANAERRFSGASETCLTEVGERQAQEMGSKLRGRYDLAFHSPLARSRRTLELALGPSEVAVEVVLADPRLAERSLGVLEGRRSVPIPQYEVGDFAYAPHGGEPYASVAQRILSFLADLACVAQERPGPLRALACTHVGPMRVLIPVLRGAGDSRDLLTSRYANAEVLGFEIDGLAIPRFLRDALLRAGAEGYDPTAWRTA